MDLYEGVAELPVTIDGWTLERNELKVSSDFARVTTTFAARGCGSSGRGEDVTYAPEDHERLAEHPPDLPTGAYTVREFSRAVDDCELFPEPPDTDVSRAHRRWAVESAALDLSLRQAETNLAGVLDRDYEPVRFVVSTRLRGDGFEPIERILDVDPAAEFKLDPTPEWTPDLVERLATTGRVRVLDLKGQYSDTGVGGPPDPDLYGMVLERFPDAVLEDPALTDETRPVLAGHEDRISWDSPITGVDALESLPIEPSWLNVKPSRFGTVRSLLDTLQRCEQRGIETYGGGQYELGVGREHVQALAAVFSPRAPNDVAPSGYNAATLSSELPTSPLAIPETPAGLGWR